jgi:hypothetical protein
LIGKEENLPGDLKQENKKRRERVQAAPRFGPKQHRTDASAADHNELL